MPDQLRLNLDQAPAYDRDDFAVSASNADAVRAIDAWPNWPSGALALAGPVGCGKTHLARAWLKRSGGILVPADRFLGGDVGFLSDRPVLWEDADRTASEEALFHLLNMIASGGGTLLLTARTLPSEWVVRLPDLRSRLNALPVVEMAQPDDAVLSAVLMKLFRERYIRPSDDLLPYLLKRMERSVPRAREIVEKLDRTAAAEHRAVSRALARQVLEDGGGD